MVFEEGRGGLFVEGHGDIECPRCGAGPMTTPGEGMRACEYCGHEKKLAVTLDDDALGAVHEALEVGESEAFRGFDPSRAKQQLVRELVPGYRAVAGYLIVGAALSLALGWVPLEMGTLVPLLLMLAVPATVALPWLLAKSMVIANRLLPGVARYDALIRAELLRLLAIRGRIDFDEAAEEVGLSPEHLEQVLHALASDGGAPVYWNHRGRELLSLHAGTREGSDCPACGGQLEVAQRVTLACRHCGGELLGQLPPWAHAAGEIDSSK